MRQFGRRSWFSIVLLAGLLATAASTAAAAPLSSGDARDVRAVILMQLHAFAADDAVAAFGYAAPGVQEAFGTPERFVAMVRASYPVVYRPASVAFHESVARGKDGALQAMRMSDGSGNVWRVVYTLQRQRDRQWRITGCEATRDGGRMT